MVAFWVGVLNFIVGVSSIVAGANVWITALLFFISGMDIAVGVFFGLRLDR